jgi:hypothetical protein
MHKLTQKFSIDQIFAIDALLIKSFNGNFNQLNEQQKVVVSIGKELATKFHTRKHNIEIRLGELKGNEKFQFTLVYFQAWALKTICINNIGIMSESHSKMMIQSVINQLDGCK